ncbi:uncharacterized protein PV09_08236 [Verruconis gallopava]|uniref:Uncharacterized protein n=1 Tax=Verruconis gallopava TaxID=253628 RepID=A0A0D1XD87_9PEZI|nr:uncharacterized protein PV09_08236 [Verruconis gallopava]KIW00196.1 hypothetical protein PV09_08236 [Verruconis gallopava]
MSNQNRRFSATPWYIHGTARAHVETDAKQAECLVSHSLQLLPMTFLSGPSTVPILSSVAALGRRTCSDQDRTNDAPQRCCLASTSALSFQCCCTPRSGKSPWLDDDLHENEKARRDGKG